MCLLHLHMFFSIIHSFVYINSFYFLLFWGEKKQHKNISLIKPRKSSYIFTCWHKNKISNIFHYTSYLNIIHTTTCIISYTYFTTSYFNINLMPQYNMYLNLYYKLYIFHYTSYLNINLIPQYNTYLNLYYKLYIFHYLILQYKPHASI